MIAAAITHLLLYLGAMIVVGDASRSLASSAYAVSNENPRDERRAIVLGGWILLVVAIVGLLVLQARDMELEPTMDSLTMLLSTTWGLGWLALMCAAFIGTVVTRLRMRRGWSTIAALGVAVAMGGLGHAAADDAFPLLSRVIDALHVLTVGAWMGGLALIAWMHWRSTPVSSGGHEDWQAFSRIATVAAPLVVLTGALAGWRRLQLAPLDQGATNQVSFATAATSDYGILLGAKLALMLVMLALGYKHRRRVLREHAPSWNTVYTELALAVVVFVVTGVLTGTAPPGE